jgi:membrane protein implicated in regulation of membrane protease activity
MEWENWQLWIAAALVLLICEVFVPGFVLACLGVGAFGGALAASLGASFALQLTVTAATSLIAFVFLRPLALRFGFSGPDTATGVEALINKKARVTKAFDPQTGLGRCKIDGDDWRSELETPENNVPPVGSMVRIVRVESNTLIVQTTPNS